MSASIDRTRPNEEHAFDAAHPIDRGGMGIEAPRAGAGDGGLAGLLEPTETRTRAEWVVQSVRTTLGVSHDRSPLTRGAEIAKRCDAQRRLLCPAVHATRAIIYILQGVEPNYHDQVLPALRDLEGGILHVMNALERVVQGKAPGSFQH